MRDWRESAAWWPVLVLLWLATLNSFGYAELITAGVCAIPCAALVPAARRAAGAHWHLRRAWLARLPLLPARVVREAVRVLTTGHGGSDAFQCLRLGDEPDHSREAILTLLVGASPGSVVVDSVDHRDLLVHPLSGKAASEAER